MSGLGLASYESTFNHTFLQKGFFMKKQEMMTPQQFINTFSKNRSGIRSSKIVPPKIGERGFGKIAVIRKPSRSVNKFAYKFKTKGELNYGK